MIFKHDGDVYQICIGLLKAKIFKQRCLCSLKTKSFKEVRDVLLNMQTLNMYTFIKDKNI